MAIDVDKRTGSVEFSDIRGEHLYSYNDSKPETPDSPASAVELVVAYRLAIASKAPATAPNSSVKKPALSHFGPPFPPPEQRRSHPGEAGTKKGHTAIDITAFAAKRSTPGRSEHGGRMKTFTSKRPNQNHLTTIKTRPDLAASDRAFATHIQTIGTVFGRLGSYEATCPFLQHGCPHGHWKFGESGCAGEREPAASIIAESDVAPETETDASGVRSRSRPKCPIGEPSDHQAFFA
ncbi:hypothetical protein FHS27_000311 [Rhodopirellula rubra]|uniref:Uncharacterized protein n=1 Tax=Aporhodopirellula rubra TaxID=980271 RepID=A0A7W5H2U5_9BACT|nr:hypothetical protein [Aporhodopirellula rubra]